MNGSLRQKLEYAFEAYDLQGTGFLDEADLDAVINPMMKLLSDTDELIDSNSMTRISFKLLDKDDNGWISKEEFVEGLIENYNLRILMSPFN